jgi:hypothetical protein
MGFSDVLLAVSALLWAYFFLPMFLVARIAADAVNGDPLLSSDIRWSKQPALWRVTLVLAAIMVYLSYLALGTAVMQISHNIVPGPTFPKQAFGVGFLCGIFLYGALTARSTWTRRKRRAS